MTERILMSTLRRRGRRKDKSSDVDRMRDTTRIRMQVVISISFVAFGLMYMIHNEADPGSQKTVFGLVGLVVGYWMK